MAKKVTVKVGAQETVSKEIPKATSALEQLESKSKSASSSIKMGWVQATAVVYGVVRGIQALKGATDNLVESYISELKTDVKLRGALKATGGLIGLNKKQLDGMAKAFTLATGASNVMVKDAQAVMLTFTQIGKDIFPEVLESAYDMSVMFDTSLSQSVLQLGKVINDPRMAEGLRRIGVSLSAAQTAAIDAAMEMGNLKKAQHIVLDELKREFGGVGRLLGESIIGDMGRWDEAMRGLKSTAGGIFAAFKKGSIETLMPIVNDLTAWLEKNTPKIYSIFSQLPEIAGDSFKIILKMLEIAFSAESVGFLFGRLADQIGIAIISAFKTIPYAFALMVKGLGDAWTKFWNETVLGKKTIPIGPHEGGAPGSILDIYKITKDKTSGAQPMLSWAEILQQYYIKSGTELVNNLKAAGYDIGAAASSVVDNYDKLLDENAALIEATKNLETKIDTGVEKFDKLNLGVEKMTEAVGSVMDSYIAAYRPEEYEEPGGGGVYVSGFSMMLGKAGDAVMAFGGKLLTAVSQLQALQAVMAPLNVIIQSAVNIIAPAINKVLAPVIGALVVLGKALGKIIIPALEALAPIIDKLADVFIWLYNNVFRHIGNALITIVGIITNTITGLINAVLTAVNWIPGVNIDLLPHMDIEAAWLPTITKTQMEKEGVSWLAAHTDAFRDKDTDTKSIYGGNTTVQRVPDIYIYQYFQGPVIGEGGMVEVGREVVGAITEFVGAGGKVTFLEAT